MQYSAGLYMRLSKDDGKSESAGIESQRLFLRTYAAQHGYRVEEEYVDDGYSGTRYDRPAFLRMRSDIEEGRINMVITKDFSRLGRNYIATGELTERYFPEHEVRFIAINDGYDSETGGDDMAPFRHVVNEMYARDISRKIRTALYAKMEAGQYIGSFAPYGYRKDPKDKNHLIVEEESACVVRWIFSLARCGISASKTAEILNVASIPIPLDHRLIRQGESGLGREWRASSVHKILRNQVYLGHTVQAKSRKLSFRSTACTPRPKTGWIVSKNTHEELVSEADFLLVKGERR